MTDSIVVWFENAAWATTEFNMYRFLSDNLSVVAFQFELLLFLSYNAILGY